MKIQELQIYGLHGNKDIRINFQDNRLIVIGKNGLGKSSVLNILYFVLSRQWNRLDDYEFSDISIKLKGRRFDISKAHLLDFYYEDRKGEARSMPSWLRRAMVRLDPAKVQEIINLNFSTMSVGEVQHYSKALDVPSKYLREAQNSLRRYASEFLSLDEVDHPLSKLDCFLRENFDFTILYLPTYRRVEKDLEAIFPHFADKVREYGRREMTQARKAENYVELVEFGMEDVELKILETLSKLKEEARSSLNSLTGSYLREVIRGEADKFERQVIEKLDDSYIDTILSRIEEDTLGEKDKRHLREVIERVKKQTEDLSDRDRYTAHYFTKVAKINKALQEKESPILSFVDLCNKYLGDKRFVYDEKKFTLHLVFERSPEGAIALKKLSSGEKQIVSLLAHVHLSDRKKLFVIIDEPELSLSVDWQEMFLPDISLAENCHFLAAATHSPFIYDNALREYAVDLSESMEVHGE